MTRSNSGRPLRRLELSLRRRFLGCGKPRPPSDWDEQYREGKWNRLGEGSESARFEAVAGFVKRMAPPVSVLDVGCGSGTLGRHFAGGAGIRYVGLDISVEAIGRARAGGVPGIFFVADADGGPGSIPDGRFDAIVFSEVLYYLENPFLTIARYRNILNRGGVFILSLWNPRRHRVLIRRLSRELECVQATDISSGDNRPWRVSVEVPRSGP